jgi:hypothetical protein
MSLFLLSLLATLSPARIAGSDGSVTTEAAESYLKTPRTRCPSAIPFRPEVSPCDAEETLFYDSGIHTTWWVSDRDSFGAAVRFTPRQYPCRVNGAVAEINYDSGTNIWLRVYDDNGDAGNPGTVLYNEHRTDIPHYPQTGFKEYDLTTPVTIASGDFYICFFQKTVWNMVFSSDDRFDSTSRQLWYFPDLGWRTPFGMDAADHLIRAKVSYETGVAEELKSRAFGFEFGPNPGNGMLRVRLPAGGKVSVFDQSGRSQGEFTVPGAAPVVIPLPGLRDGVYLLRAAAGGASFTGKLVLSR